MPLLTLFGASQRAARGRRAAGALRPLPAALRRRLHRRGLPLPEAAAGAAAERRARRCRSTTLAAAQAEAARGRGAGRGLRALADLRRELAAQERRRLRPALARRRSACCARTPTSRAATRVGEDDVVFLEHVLWRDPAERAEVRATIRELLRGYEDEVRVLLYQTRELRDYALRAVGDAASCAAAPRSRRTPRSATSSARCDAILADARERRPAGRRGSRRCAHEIAQIEREMLARL